MNDSMWRDQNSRCYDQLKVVDEMNDLGSYEPRPLDVMNSLGLQVK